MNLCINCGIATAHCHKIGRRRLEDENDSFNCTGMGRARLKRLIKMTLICQACWNYANAVSLDGNIPEGSEQTPTGHQRVCIHCGRSLLRRVRCHQLTTTGTVQEHEIHEVIRGWILPHTVGASSVVCHSCWVRANRASRHFHHLQQELSTSDSNLRGRIKSRHISNIGCVSFIH